ncbi:MAG: TolC family protein [Proteobacteria bacterium]|nr:TolC family protein [Pseudomonadota bacterium]
MSFFKKIKFLTIYLISCFFINFFSISNLLASDFTLDLSVNEALKNSLELKSQHYKLEATKYSLGEAYSSKDWSSSLSSTFNSSNKQSDRVGAYTNDDTTTSTISLSKNLFDGGESFERYRIAKDNIRLNELRLYKVEQDIILETIEAYLDVYTNQSVVRLRKRSLTRFKENVTATKLKLQAGTVTPTVLAEAEAKLAKANYELILAEGNLNKSVSKFKSVTNFKSIPHNLKLPILKFQIPETELDIIKISSQKNINILIAKLERDLAEKNIDLEKSDNRPNFKIEFFAKDSQSSLNSSASDYQSYGTNLTFSTPLFYNESSKNSIRRLDKLAMASSINLSEQLRQVELNAISSFQNYQSAVAKTIASMSEEKSSLLALEGIQKEAEFGIRTVLDVLDAEVDYLNASANLITSEADEIYEMFYIKSIMGNLSQNEFTGENQINFNQKNKKLDFKIFDLKMFN